MRFGAYPLLVGMALGSMLPRTVLGDETPQKRAAILNEEGRNADDIGDYARAVERYRAAYEAYPDKRILFNLAQVYRRQKEYESALKLYRAIERSIPPETPDREATIENLEKLIRELERLKADHNVGGSSPPEGTRSSATATPLPVVVSKIVEQRPWYSNGTGWWLVGGGAVALGASVALYVSASSLEDQLKTARDIDQPSIRSDVQTRRTIGTIGFVVGGLAVAGGVTVFLVSPRTVTRDIVPIKDLRVAVLAGGLALSGRF